MSIEAAAPAFPDRESLVRFFKMPPHALVPIAEVAALLGMTIDAFREVLRAEGSDALDSSIPWTEAAGYLLDAWPRADLLDALGAEASNLIPSEFQLVAVNWSLPIFLVRALEHQAAAVWANNPRLPGSAATGGRQSRRVQDYVADLLYNEIQPDTVRALGDDSAFMAAYRYPAAD
jgi:hypothetical protein